MTDNQSKQQPSQQKQSTGNGQQESQSATELRTDSNIDVTPPFAADESAGSSSLDTDNSVKEEQIGTYMYLPETQVKELNRLYNLIKAEYEFKYDAKFEKNWHFYPLIIYFGMDRLNNMELSEIRDKLEEIS